MSSNSCLAKIQSILKLHRAKAFRYMVRKLKGFLCFPGTIQMPGGSVRAQCRKQNPLKVVKTGSDLIWGMGSGESSGWAGEMGTGELQTSHVLQK